MKKIFFLLCLFCSVAVAQAQNTYNSSGRTVAKKPVKQKGFDRDNLVLGGDFRFNGGTGYLSAGLAPTIGYKLFTDFYAGVKIGYSYDRYRVDPSLLPAGSESNLLTYNTFSGGIWARYLFMESIFVHTEFEYNIFDNYFFNDLTGLLEKKKVESPSALLGVGFRQPVSDRISFNSTILFDILNDPNSYYTLSGKGGFDYRIGVLIGF
jgi:hypothetical protein